MIRRPPNAMLCPSTTLFRYGTVSAPSLTFTAANWSVAQTVTVTGVDDHAQKGALTYTIVISPATGIYTHYSETHPADRSVSLTDNDVAGSTVNPVTLLVPTE